MTFEQELRVLVEKYKIKDVEITYTQKTTINMSLEENINVKPIEEHKTQNISKPILDIDEGATDAEKEFARRLTHGPIGKITP